MKRFKAKDAFSVGDLVRAYEGARERRYGLTADDVAKAIREFLMKGLFAGAVGEVTRDGHGANFIISGLDDTPSYRVIVTDP